MTFWQKFDLILCAAAGVSLAEGHPLAGILFGIGALWPSP